MARPPLAWVVLAPVARRKVPRGRYEIRKGTGAYLAILDDDGRPGATELAVALSRIATEPVYLLQFLDEDFPRVDAYRDGKDIGVVNALPGDVAHAVGCPFVDDGRPGVDLTPHAFPPTAPGAVVILGNTIAQWQHLIAHEDGWSYLIDGADGRSVIDFLDHADVATREVAVRLVSALGYHGVTTRADDAIAKLRAVGSEEAREAADAILEIRDREVVRVEYPWLGSQFAKVTAAEILERLGESRVEVRRVVYGWLASSSLDDATRDEILPHLDACFERETDRMAKDFAGYALEYLQR